MIEVNATTMVRLCEWPASRKKLPRISCSFSLRSRFSRKTSLSWDEPMTMAAADVKPESTG